MVDPRALARELYAAAIAGADPEAAARSAVARLTPAPTPGARTWIIAIGKASIAMTSGAVRTLVDRGIVPAGGVVVAPSAAPSPHPAVEVIVGDHPVPGARSLAAARAIGEIVARVRPGDLVLALISGGGTSLAAAPDDAAGLTQEDVASLYRSLLRSGADIATMNAVRKRLTRWGAGRLARALAGARLVCLAASDVAHDDVAVISSGPCSPDPVTAPTLVGSLQAAGLWSAIPGAARMALEAAARGELPETPKPSDPAFRQVTTRVILANAQALAATAARASALGIDEVVVATAPLIGEASICGVRLASELLALRKRERLPKLTRCVIWGGETTVTLGPAPPATDGSPRGGRNQELALAAARSLGDAGDRAEGVVLLAAGTDGRDGPTDAAGAIVDRWTWSAIGSAGRDPAADLACHDAYDALDAAGALLRTGPSGTNVMDVVIGLLL